MKKIAYLFALGLTLTACSGNKQQMMGADNNEFAVETVETGAADLSTTYPATIRGVQDVEIRAKVSGNIVRQLVDEGDFVKAGQVLFVIDPTQYKAAVDQARAAVKSAQTAIRTQQLTVNNKRALRQKEIVSQYDLEVAENQLQTLRSQLEQAKAALANANDQLSFCTVRATSSGVIGTIPYRVGALVGPSTQEPLTVVSNLSQMYAYFSMTEKQLLDMTRTSGGIEAAIREMPAVSLVLADGTTYERQGKVSAVSGVAGQVSFPVNKSNAILVQQKSTVEIQNKKFVYLVDKNNKVHSTEIEVMPQNDGQNYIVTKGLSVGDRIVVEGVNKLKNDMQIKPITPEQSAKQLEKSMDHMAKKKMPGQD